MAWTKAQLVEEHFAELALAGYSVDTSPEEKQAALRRMDAMVAGWEGRGIRIGYKLPASPELSSLNDDAGIADQHAEAVFMNLAVRQAAGKGKTLTPATVAAASLALQSLMNDAATPGPSQYRSGMVAGQGNRGCYSGRRNYLPPATDQSLSLSPGGDLTFSSE